jgi:hypothetical protein
MPHGFGSIGHLAGRLAGSLRPGGPPPGEEAWARSLCLPGEVALWARMSGPDRRHAVGVAHRTASALGGDGAAGRPVLAAALLHDVGKIDAGLGTGGRVAATLVAMAAGRARLAGWSGRMGRYVRHDELGADLLAAAGSDALTVTWAREHHWAPADWTLPRAVAEALKAADDD